MKRFPQAILLLIVLATRGQAYQSDVAVEYPDHSQLLVVLDSERNSRPVEHKEDWLLRTKHIRANMERVMGALPDVRSKCPLATEVLDQTSSDGYVRKKINYTAEVGDQVPAWLLIPTGKSTKSTRPAVLCLHQTNNMGKDEPAGLAGLPSLAYAHELAQRGYVCIVPDYPSFGEYAYDFSVQGAHFASGSMKAVWNNVRALDVLESTPEVDRDRIGVIGHSLGGHNALFTAVFDERIKAVITSCGFTPFHDYYHGELRGWTSDRYMPRIRDVFESNPAKVPFDFYEVIAAIAPRGCFSSSPISDKNFDVEGVKKAFDKASKVYDLFEARHKLTLITPDTGHEFPEESRQQAYRWLDRMLQMDEPRREK